METEAVFAKTQMEWNVNFLLKWLLGVHHTLIFSIDFGKNLYF